MSTDFVPYCGLYAPPQQTKATARLIYSLQQQSFATGLLMSQFEGLAAKLSSACPTCTPA